MKNIKKLFLILSIVALNFNILSNRKKADTDKIPEEYKTYVTKALMGLKKFKPSDITFKSNANTELSFEFETKISLKKNFFVTNKKKLVINLFLDPDNLTPRQIAIDDPLRNNRRGIIMSLVFNPDEKCWYFFLTRKTGRIKLSDLQDKEFQKSLLQLKEKLLDLAKKTEKYKKLKLKNLKLKLKLKNDIETIERPEERIEYLHEEVEKEGPGPLKPFTIETGKEKLKIPGKAFLF